MTLQQLRYIVAIDRFRSFAKAAAELEVTQPTLSALLVKLEEELGVRIFERSNKNVSPTAIGARILSQAENILSDVDRITETVVEQRDGLNGAVSIGIGPTIAPYLVPWFIKRFTASYPDVKLTVNEMRGDSIIDALKNDRIDIGIAISGSRSPDVDAIPFYDEAFYVYMSKDCLMKIPVFNPADLVNEKMWIMKESQCMRESAFSFCKTRSIGRHIYEAGSIETLIRIVDINGGFTIIPEMHLPMLTEDRRNNVRPIDGKYVSGRSVSIYLRKDFVRRKMLRAVIDTFLKIIPQKMINRELSYRLSH